jgi:hypothetical protein
MTTGKPSEPLIIMLSLLILTVQLKDKQVCGIPLRSSLEKWGTKCGIFHRYKRFGHKSRTGCCSNKLENNNYATINSPPLPLCHIDRRKNIYPSRQ